MKLPIVPDWQCRMTGDCCRTVRAIRVSGEELALLAARREGFPLTAAALPDGFFELQANPCPFLDGNTCTVYDIRPFKCRAFQCHRAEGEPFDPSGPDGCLNLSIRLFHSRETRRAYKLNQRKAQRWALKHGWKGTER